MLLYNININYYELLGVGQTATLEEIKKNYRKLALKHHPDKGGDPEEFKKIAEAYELLTDEETKNQYDFERTHSNNTGGQADDTMPPKSGNPSSAESDYRTASSLSSKPVVFNTVNTTTFSSNTSLVAHNGMKNSASEGLKAETMSNDELANLAKAVEQVALAVAKNINLLNRLYNFQLWDIAEKHPSFAYQIIACRETRHYLYEGNYSHNIRRLLESSYNLLLLIAGSAELTEQFLYENGTSILNGTQLHSIYQAHLKKRGSCSAFMALIESNPQLNKLFKNIQILQSGSTKYDLNRLELLEYTELKKLAEKNLSVATMVIKNKTLLNKFSDKYSQASLIDILLAHPKSLMDDFFKSSRSFYFDKSTITIHVVSACKNKPELLLHLINAQESKFLNGFDLEKLINGNIAVQQQIYQVEQLKKRHQAYIKLVKQITSHSISTETPLSKTVKEVYQPLTEAMGNFGECELLWIVRHLAQSYDHQILASNSVLILNSYNWSLFSYDYAALSETFFCTFFDNESLRKSCYEHTELLCSKYFIAFERMIHDPEILLQLSDEGLYNLQQQWIRTEETKVRALFNENPSLMPRWERGVQINKLHQGVLVSEYKEHPILQRESEPVIKIRTLINTVQQCLTFNNITFAEGDKTFITRLAEQANFLSTIASSNTIDKNTVPGVFWFLLFMHAPRLLEEHQPLDFISRQIEALIHDLKNGKKMETSWLIKGHKNNDDRTTYELYSVPEQEKSCFNLLLTQVDINDKALWEHLLHDQAFIKNLSDNTVHFKQLALLNWDCPIAWVKQLTQQQLINVVIHLFSNYSDLTLRERLLDNFLPNVTDINVFINKMPALTVEQRAEFYLRLLNNGQLTLVAFLKDPDNIALLRQFKSIQQYVIDSYSHEVKSDLYEVIDLYCKQKLMGDALTVFSLLHESKVEHNINKLVPNYSELPQYTYQKMMIQGLACLTVGLTLGFVAPQLLLAAAVVLIAYGIYDACTHSIPVEITYREALSRNNSSQFFKAAPLQTASEYKSDRIPNVCVMRTE